MFSHTLQQGQSVESPKNRIYPKKAFLDMVSNLHYTHCNTPKRVTSGGPPQRLGNTAPKKCRSGGEAFGDTVFDLTGQAIEPQTFRPNSDALDNSAHLPVNWISHQSLDAYG